MEPRRRLGAALGGGEREAGPVAGIGTTGSGEPEHHARRRPKRWPRKTTVRPADGGTQNETWPTHKTVRPKQLQKNTGTRNLALMSVEVTQFGIEATRASGSWGLTFSDSDLASGPTNQREWLRGLDPMISETRSDDSRPNIVNKCEKRSKCLTRDENNESPRVFHRVSRTFRTQTKLSPNLPNLKNARRSGILLLLKVLARRSRSTSLQLPP